MYNAATIPHQIERCLIMSEAESKLIFQQKFNALLSERGITQKEIATICGVSTSTVSTWSKGLNIPRMDKIERLANHFDLQVSYFVERDSLAQSPNELNEYLEILKTRPECRMLFSLAKDSSKEDVEKAVAIIEAIRRTEGR